MDKIKIIIATHKEYWMPQDSMYLPVHVGAEGKDIELGYVKDNIGDNISSKNKNYCELTGLYWAWKNLEAEYIGLVHYRRHFCKKGFYGACKGRVLNAKQAEKLLKSVDILLPNPRINFFKTNYSQYLHAHHAIDLDMTREIISEIYSDYLMAYDKSMKKMKGHRFNMFIMKIDKFNEFCEWLFNILFELEKRLDISKYNDYDSRVFGFVGERLLDVWIEMKGYKYRNIPYVFMEKQNWLVTSVNFIKRKLIIREK